MATTVSTNRVALYARVSTEEQREGQTIQSQIAELERFARDREWLVCETYRDDGWSGSLLARPELDRLRDHAAKRIFDIVLLNDVDRLARDVTHLGIIKRDLERHGVRVVFRKLPSENNPTHNLMVNILGSFAEFEREMIADRTRRGKRHKVEARNQYLGGIPPFGYRYTPRDHASGREGVLAILPEETNVVRQMFNWVDAEGMSARSITARLNRTGIPARHRGRWAKSSVLRILHSETYAGVWHYNKLQSCEPRKPLRSRQYSRSLKSSNRLRPQAEWISVTLPAHLSIVPRDQWLRVQQQLKKNLQFSLRNSKHLYLLRGLLRCGACEAAYCGDPVHGRFYYRCSKRCKRLPTIAEDALNDRVWSAVWELLTKPDLILAKVASLQKERNEQRDKRVSDNQRVERELDQLRAEEARLLEAYRLGVLSATILGRELEQISSRRNVLESQSASNAPVPMSVEVVQERVEKFCSSIASDVQRPSFDIRQRILRLVVDRVVIESAGQLRIKCKIPLTGADSESGQRPREPLSDPSSDGRIAGRASQHDDRNPTGHGRIVDTTSAHCARNPADTLKFEIARRVQRIRAR